MRKTKTCSKCHKRKKIRDFFPRYDRSGKLQPQCKTCHYESGRLYKIRNPVRMRAYLKQTWKWRLEKKFGITFQRYEELLKLQGGVCAICRQLQVSKRMAVDHDHKTHKVRGVLCDRCNRALGLLGDSLTLLKAARAYLVKHSAKG